MTAGVLKLNVGMQVKEATTPAQSIYHGVMVVWIAATAFAWVCMMCQADCLQKEALDGIPNKPERRGTVATQILKAPFE